MSLTTIHVSGRLKFYVCEGVWNLAHTGLVPSLPEAVAFLLRTLDKARAVAHLPAGWLVNVRRSLGTGRM